ELMIREVAGEILKEIGYESACSSDGREAVDLYQRAKEAGEPFDAVILDLNIPGELGGRETLAKLKTIDPSVKAIISSGSFEDPAVADFRKFGFSGWLAKPYDSKALAKILYDLLHSI
ncbi:MAG: response regulator, partial [Nitrospirae bacterium]|nr:response regulator [Nitrospirota bacterium]